MDDTPNTNVSRARSLAERLFDRDSLLQTGLSANECQELYYDMRRFFERYRNSKDVKKDLRKYSICGAPRRNDPVVADKRTLIRSGLLIGCVLVRESEGLERAGVPFPSRENVRMYPRVYRYTGLDMLLSKQFNNDRVARTSEGIRETLHSMYRYHPAMAERVSRQSVSSLESIRVHNRIALVFNHEALVYVVYASTTASGRIRQVSHLLLLHVMYSTTREDPLRMSLASIYSVTTEPARDGTIPVIDFRVWVDSTVSEAKQTKWMNR